MRLTERCLLLLLELHPDHGVEVVFRRDELERPVDQGLVVGGADGDVVTGLVQELGCALGVELDEDRRASVIQGEN